MSVLRWLAQPRVTVLLFIGLLLSSLYLVRTQHEVRTRYVALERAQAQARQLETEHSQLEIRKRAEGTSQKVEHIARDRLNMRPATPAVTTYVQAPARPPRPAAGTESVR